jgi:hypothetical protein
MATPYRCNDKVTRKNIGKVFEILAYKRIDVFCIVFIEQMSIATHDIWQKKDPR